MHLPIHRKGLNSFTWNIWLSFIHKNTFDLQTTWLWWQNFYITSPHLLGAVLSGLLERLSPRLEVLKIPPEILITANFLVVTALEVDTSLGSRLIGDGSRWPDL